MQLDLALGRQEALSKIADKQSRKAVTAWQRNMSNDFDASWARIAPEITALATAGQVAAATGASPFLARTARADAITDPSAGNVATSSFGGVDDSGRSIDGLMYGSVTSAKTAIGAGAGLQGALVIGATFLAAMMHTAVLDAGRASDLTGMTSRSYTHYIRVVSSGACSRCAILAGIASAQTAFLRHPRCRCTAAPEKDFDKPTKSKYSSPDDYFQSLSTAEQNRVFTNAGADAIRAGGQIEDIVSARQGAAGIDYSRAILSPRTLPNSGRRLARSVIGRDAVGQPIYGYTTTYSTTRRGNFAKQGRIATGTYAQRIRLMPETVVALTDDVALRQVLLRDAGYISYPTSGPDWIEKRRELIRADRAEADRFYRSKGIQL